MSKNPFPLPQGHYFHPPAVSARAHSGDKPGDPVAVRALQQALGVPETGVYDTETESAARERLGKAWSGVVDEDAWKRLHTPKRRTTSKTGEKQA